jgi:integrase
MTPPLKKELQNWLEQLKQDEERYGDRYHKGDMDMLFRLPDGKVVEPTLIRKWFLQWQDEHPEFERIVFHSLRHSSATYYLMISDGDIKAVQGNTGHAQAGTLVNVYAHIQQESRRELAQKFSNEFYPKEFYPKEENKPVERTVLDAQELLQLLQNADPLVKKQLALALFA